MEKKSLLQQQIAGYQVTLFEDGAITLQRDEKLIGKGSLDSVVLTQWGEAHLDGCNARLGRDADETMLIYDQIDDALSLALTQSETLREQLYLPRVPKQLELLAEDWLERLSPEERSAPDSVLMKLRRAEYLSDEQAREVLRRVALLASENL